MKGRPHRTTKQPAYFSDYVKDIDLRTVKQRQSKKASFIVTRDERQNDLRETILRAMKRGMRSKRSITGWKHIEGVINCFRLKEFQILFSNTVVYGLREGFKKSGILPDNVRAILCKEQFEKIIGDELVKNIAKTRITCNMQYPVVFMFNHRKKQLDIAMKYETRSHDGSVIDMRVISSEYEKKLVSKALENKKHQECQFELNSNSSKRISDQTEIPSFF